MTIQRILIVMTLLLFQAANAQPEILIDAFETAPSNINFPASDSGTVVFKPCSYDCKKDFLHVTLGIGTAYLVKGNPVKFADFRKEFLLIKHKVGSYALVSFDTKTKIVTSINIAG